MVQAMTPPGQRHDAAESDYLVELENERPAPPIAVQMVRILRAILVLIVAAVSLALFWLVATTLGVL